MEACPSVRIAGTNILCGAFEVPATKHSVLADGLCREMIPVLEIDELAYMGLEEM